MAGLAQSESILYVVVAKVAEICPSLTPFRLRVSTALRSRDAGKGRASVGDPRRCLDKVSGLPSLKIESQ